MTGLWGFARILILIVRKFIPDSNNPRQGRLALGAVMAALALIPPMALAIEISDSHGHVIHLDKPAKSIVSLYGAFNETLLALGAANFIKARASADSDIPVLASLPAVGTHMRPNVELIAAMKPDLVLQLGGRKEAMLLTENLRQLGLNVLVFDIRSFADLFAMTLKLGQVTGREARAAKLVADWRERLDKLAAQYPGSRPKVYYEAREANLLAAGRGNIVNDIISAAGGENIVTDAKKFRRINEEELIALNPDICVVQQGPMNPMPTPISERPNLRNLACARQGGNFIVQEKLFARPGPNSVVAAEELAARLAQSVSQEDARP